MILAGLLLEDQVCGLMLIHNLLMKKILFILFIFLSVTGYSQLIVSGAGPDTRENGGGGEWVSPTSKENDAWIDAQLIYDENLGTFGWCTTKSNSVTLLIDAINCSKIRIYAGKTGGGQADLLIEVYYLADFHEIYDGTLTEDTWVEIAVGSTQSITKARLTTGNAFDNEVLEFEFWSL